MRSWDSKKMARSHSVIHQVVFWYNRWQGTGALQQFNTAIEIVQTNP